jgi:hypothetical protein
VGVGRIALAAVVLAGLVVPGGLAGTAPKWTANARTITVHGTSCRITTASPARATLRLYYVGAEAKIACAAGVLRAIDVLKQLPSIISQSVTRTPPTAPISGGLVIGQTQASATTTVGTVSAFGSGSFPITAVSSTSISVGPLSLTCTTGEGSPDIGGLQVGERLTRMECRNGVLTSLTRA